MAGRAKPSGFAGKHQKMFRPAAGTPDPGEAASGIAAVEITLDDLLDDGPEEAVLPLEPALVFGDEPFEMMEKHPVEDGPLRMPRTIHSRHSRGKASRNEPISWIGSRLPGKRRGPRPGRGESG